MVLQTQELNKERVKRHMANKEIYKEILLHIYTKIKLKNQSNQFFLVYHLSPIMLGKPLINIDHALMYIVKKLNAGKFKTFVQHNSIYIDWA